MPTIEFESFSIVAPAGWEDYTEAGDSHTTLGRGDGVGALQFSISLYVEGPLPDPSSADLSEMVASFARVQGLAAPSEVAIELTPLRLSAGSFTWGENFLRVWQISDGRSFAFVTYTCESGQEGQELGECERMVRTLRIPG